MLEPNFHLVYSREPREKLCFKVHRTRRESDVTRKLRNAFVVGLLFATFVSNSSLAGKDEPLPVFDGVITEFSLTRSHIRSGQQLKVHVIFRNTTNAPRVFHFLDFGVDARIYSKGKLLENSCEALQYPVLLQTLQPGEVFEGTTEVFTTACYKLAPGEYSIRFNYNLRAFENDTLQREYEEKYNHPPDGIVPWDGRDHQFTVVK